MSAYREESARETEPAELRFVPRKVAGHGISNIIVFVVFAIGMTLTGIIAASWSGTAGGVVLVVTLVATYAAHRGRKRGEHAVVLRIERGVLLVDGRWSISLAEIDHVEVESSTIKSMARDHQREVYRQGIGEDLSRIVLALADETRAPMAITDDDVTHEDCVENAAKVRRFLRSHGWTPVDERPD